MELSTSVYSLGEQNVSLLIPHLGPFGEFAVPVKSQAQIFSAGRGRHRCPYSDPCGRVVAVTCATEAKSDGERDALSQHPLRKLSLTGFADHLRLAQLSQSILVGIRANASSPLAVLDRDLLGAVAQLPIRRTNTMNEQSTQFHLYPPVLSTIRPISNCFHSARMLKNRLVV